MAKRSRERAPAPNPVDPVSGQSFSRELLASIQNVRKGFGTFVQAFSPLDADRGKLAPIFMACFDDWRKETGRNSFIEFCRVVDPTIPTVRDEYRNNPAYRAAQYLQRHPALNRRSDANPAGRATPIRNSQWKLARLLATVVRLIRPADVPEFWTQIGAEFDLRKGQIDALKRQTETTEPLIEVSARPQPLKLVHMDVKPAQGEGTTAEPIARTA